MLTFSKVSKSYKGAAALKDVSFKIEKGAITVILGANGAGKSTIMKLAAGIISPDSGDVLIDGIPPANRQARQLIGYLAENENIAENEEAFCWLRAISFIKGKDEKEAERVFRLCGLNKAAGRPAGKLSKGYKKRLALAAALIGNPPLLLLDEPAFGLDPVQTDETVNLLKNLSREGAVAVSTHSPEAARNMASRMIVLSKGEVKADFKIDEIEKDGPRAFVVRTEKSQSDISNILRRTGASSVQKISAADCDEYMLLSEKDLRKEILEILKKENIGFLELYSCKKSLLETIKDSI